MNKEHEFLIYCIEEYKRNKELIGDEVHRLFKKTQVHKFVIDCYETLHTMSSPLIIDDIDRWIDEQNSIT